MMLQPFAHPPSREGGRADYAYGHVKRLILEGRAGAGSRLDVNGFVQELGVSRQPVIQALSRLAAEGFVKIVPQVGCWVATPDPEDRADFFRLFAVTEGLAAELATERASPAELAELAAIDRRIGALLREPPAGGDAGRACRTLDRAFHEQVHVMARSDVVRGAARGMWDRCDFYLNVHARSAVADRTGIPCDDHAQVIKAMAKGDARRARKAMRQHMQQLGRQLATC